MLCQRTNVHSENEGSTPKLKEDTPKPAPSDDMFSTSPEEDAFSMLDTFGNGDEPQVISKYNIKAVQVTFYKCADYFDGAFSKHVNGSTTAFICFEVI